MADGASDRYCAFRRAALDASSVSHPVVGGSTFDAACSCGHIGCCDSSPSQHASKHAAEGRSSGSPGLRARRGLVLRLRERAVTQVARRWLRRAITRSTSPCRDQRVGCPQTGSDSCTDQVERLQEGEHKAMSISGDPRAVRTIDRDELSVMVERGDRFRLVMALNEWAFQAKHIPGSEHFNTPEELFSAPAP